MSKIIKKKLKCFESFLQMLIDFVSKLINENVTMRYVKEYLIVT